MEYIYQHNLLVTMSGKAKGDSKPLKKEDEEHEPQVESEQLKPNESQKFNAADSRRKEDDRSLLGAHSKLLKLKADLQKAQLKVDEAQRAYDKARNVAYKNAEYDADDLLLEPTPWNNYYKQLKAYYDREGHSNFKRTITDADAEGLSEAEAKEIRTLSWWTCRQRKFKRRGELEQYKILLLNRLNFNWDPHAGPGPEKWLKNYGLLKEFKQKHGHVKVPVRYAESETPSVYLLCLFAYSVIHFFTISYSYAQHHSACYFLFLYTKIS